MWSEEGCLGQLDGPLVPVAGTGKIEDPARLANREGRAWPLASGAEILEASGGPSASCTLLRGVPALPTLGLVLPSEKWVCPLPEGPLGIDERAYGKAPRSVSGTEVAAP